WSARIGRIVPAVGIWSPCRIRGRERRRAPAPRSGDALDCRWQSGAEQRGLAESDGALRDAMARGARELRCSCRPVWSVDRPCARPEGHPVASCSTCSSVSPTHGEQEMSVWNGHYACTCYHPLFVFNQFGDLERCALRAGNVHSADGWDDVLKLVVARYQGKVSRLYFRADAAFAMPEVYQFLEAERIKYAIRLPANQVLQSRIGYLLTRPVGRPPHHVRPMPISATQARTWTKPRRVIAKVEWHPGELYPRVGFIVTNMSRQPERVEPIKDWSLTSLKDKLIKIGAMVSHGRYVIFQMAEVAIARQMFQEILRLIAELGPQPPPAPA